MKLWNNQKDHLKLLQLLLGKNNTMKTKKKVRSLMKKMIINSMMEMMMASKKINKLKLPHQRENSWKIKLNRKDDNKHPNKGKDNTSNRKKMNHSSKVPTKNRNNNRKKSSWRKSQKLLSFRNWIGRTWRAKRTQGDKNQNKKHNCSKITFKINSSNSDTSMSSITTTTRIWETLRGSIIRNRSNNYLRDIKMNRIITIPEHVLRLSKT